MGSIRRLSDQDQEAHHHLVHLDLWLAKSRESSNKYQDDCPTHMANHLGFSLASPGLLATWASTGILHDIPQSVSEYGIDLPAFAMPSSPPVSSESLKPSKSRLKRGWVEMQLDKRHAELITLMFRLTKTVESPLPCPRIV